MLGVIAFLFALRSYSMKLLLAIVFFLLAVSQLPFSMVRSILFGCIFASICSSLLIYPDYEFLGWGDVFTVLSIVAFFSSLIFFLFPKFVLEINDKSQNSSGFNITPFLIIIGFVAVFYNLLLISGGIGFLSDYQVSITEYKNTGLVEDYMIESGLSGNSFVFRFFSLFAWFSLCVCFYYYAKGKIFLALLLFVVSLNIPLLSVSGFSRSGIFYYAASLLLLYARYYGLLSRKQRFFLSVSIIVMFVIALLAFSLITMSRFEGYSNWWVYVESGSDLNVVIFSVLYYFGAWIDNTIHIMRDMEAPLLGGFNGYLSSVFFVLKGFGFEVLSKSEVWESYFGHMSSLFLGLFLDTLYDVGSIGMLLIVSIFLLFYVFRVFYVRGFLTDAVFSVFFFQYFIMFFSGNLFSYFFIGMAFLISVLLCILIKSNFFRI